MLTFARAEGTTAFTAPSTDSTSMPVAVRAGPRPQPLTEPARADERHAVLDLGELAKLLVAEGRAGPLLALETLDRHIAMLVVHRRERADNGEERIGCCSAELAGVLRAGERPHLDGHDGHSTEADRERRNAGTDAPHVPDHDRVCGEQLGPRRREGGEGAARLLLTLDDDLDPDGWLSFPRHAARRRA